MLLYYVRHGNPIYNPDSLTPLGERQAEAVGRYLANLGVDDIYASSSNRALLTAKPLSEITNKQITVLDWCNEGYAWKETTVPREGEPNARTWCFQSPKYMRYFNQKDVRALGDAWYTHPLFAGLDFEKGVLRVNAEVDAFMLGYGYRHDRENGVYIPEEPNKKKVALFAHQGFSMMFLSSLLDIPYNVFCTHTDIGHSCVSMIEFRQTDGVVIPRLLSHANDAHLPLAGLPTRFHNASII